ncbi:MAG: hypothetical protein KJ737_24475 [Proteobacteria bacterium]|nr:hypothetical protein [Pseudomonadota bacterium]
MPDEKEKQDSTIDAAKKTEKYSSVRIISQAVTKLDNARRNIQMYPEGHEAIQKSIGDTSETLSHVFRRISRIDIRAEKDCLSVENETLDMQQTANREFLSFLKQYDIAAIQFEKGVPQKEIYNFLKLFSGVKDHNARHMDAVKEKLKTNFPHISVSFVDYSGLGLTVEDEVSGPVEHSGGHAKASGKGLQSSLQGQPKASVYVIGDSEDSPVGSDPSPHLKTREAIVARAEDYEKTLGSYLGQTQVKGDALKGHVQDVEKDLLSSVADYEKSLKTYLDQPAEDRKGYTGGSTEDDKDMLSSVEDYEKMLERYLNHPPVDKDGQPAPHDREDVVKTFLKQLNPRLKKQFQSFDFDKILNGEIPASFDKLFNDEDARTTFDALRQANEEDREISPTLIGLVKKMLTSSGGEKVKEENLDRIETEKLHDKIEDLFEREAYEKFIGDDYDKRLKKLTDFSSEQLPSDQSFPLDSHLKTFADDYITRQISRALMSLIQDQDTFDIYKDYMSCLLAISSDLMTYKEFDLLSQIRLLLKSHGDSHADNKVRIAAQKGVNHFLSPSFTAKVLEAIDSDHNETARRANDFFVSLGPEIVPALMALFFRTPDSSARAHLVNKLGGYREETIAQINKLLESQDVFLSEDLITLMVRFKDDSFVSYFKAILDNDDPDTQEKAIDVLLEYGDETAVERVRGCILSKEEELYLPAIKRAGRFRIRALVSDLAKELERSLFTMTNIPRKEAIVMALGAIGDNGALPVFEKIARRSLCLKPGKLNDLKALLYQSLNEFQREDITGLIHIGKKLKDQRIKAALEKLTDKGGNHI